MRKIKLTDESKKGILENLLRRSPDNYREYEERVNSILEDVRKNKDEALFRYTERFDEAKVDAFSIKVRDNEIEEAYSTVSERFIKVIKIFMRNSLEILLLWKRVTEVF